MVSGNRGRNRAQGETTMPMPNLPHEIIVEILSRTPAKSLIRFRCVCKLWNSLFSNPRFIQTHINRTTLNPNYTNNNDHVEEEDDDDDDDDDVEDDETLFETHLDRMTDDDETFVFVNRDAATGRPILSLLLLKSPNLFTLDHPLIAPRDIDVVGSINGLVCLCSTSSHIFLLWNPATKQYKELPLPRTTYLGDASVGFSFDPVTNDYKIVRITWWKGPPNRQTRVEVYSESAGGRWREIPVTFPFALLGTKCETIVKGEPYWRAYLDGVGAVVVWFDAGEEVFKHLPIMGLSMPRIRFCLGNFRDSLALAVEDLVDAPLSQILPDEESDIEASFVDEVSIIDVCTVEEDGAWSKKYIAGPFEGAEMVVGCCRNGQIFVKMKDGRLILYDSRTQETKKVPITGAMAGNFRVCDYKASFVPIRGAR